MTVIIIVLVTKSYFVTVQMYFYKIQDNYCTVFPIFKQNVIKFDYFPCILIEH